jgi:hypothetical protein
MTSITRRDLIRIGTGTVIGAVLSRSLGSIPVAAQVTGLNESSPMHFSFGIAPGSIRRIKEESPFALGLAPWALYTEQGQPTSLATDPLALTLAQLEKWADRRAECDYIALPSEEIAAFNALMNARLIGGPDLADIAGHGVSAVVAGQMLDLSLDFQYDEDPKVSLSSSRDLMAQLASHSELVLPAISAVPNAPPAISLYGWRLQFRGPETHPLGSCVSQSVRHFHVELFRYANGGYKYVTNFHLGTYRSSGRPCFVLYNSYSPRVCWKQCGPSLRDLQDMFKWLVAAAVAIVGVYLAAWAIAAIAQVVAAALFATLLVL